MSPTKNPKSLKGALSRSTKPNPKVDPMKKFILTGMAVAMLAVPAAAMADEPDGAFTSRRRRCPQRERQRRWRAVLADQAERSVRLGQRPVGLRPDHDARLARRRRAGPARSLSTTAAQDLKGGQSQDWPPFFVACFKTRGRSGPAHAPESRCGNPGPRDQPGNVASKSAVGGASKSGFEPGIRGPCRGPALGPQWLKGRLTLCSRALPGPGRGVQGGPRARRSGELPQIAALHPLGP